MGKTIFAFASSLALAGFAGTPLLAEDGAWRVGNDQIHIVNRTIDVSTATGRAALLGQVERAAERLCRDRIGSFRDACEAETLRETARRSGAWNRALTLALHERGGTQVAAR